MDFIDTIPNSKFQSGWPELLEYTTDEDWSESSSTALSMVD